MSVNLPEPFGKSIAALVAAYIEPNPRLYRVKSYQTLCVAIGELVDRCERLRYSLKQMPVDEEELGLHPGDLDDNLKP
jgi:hypothetical protein